MKNLFSSMNNNNNTSHLIDYRFSNEFLFFKLCEEIQFKCDSAKMIEGMYIPLNYLDLFLKSSSSSGVRGGKIITEYDLKDKISNSFFINLVSSGWIGTKSINSDKVTQIIKELLEQKHSIILAEYREKITEETELPDI